LISTRPTHIATPCAWRRSDEAMLSRIERFWTFATCPYGKAVPVRAG
jgi:hypothetical protein